MKNTLLLSIIALTSIMTYSQTLNNDYLVTKENDTINCKVLELKGKKIKYIENETQKKRKKNIFKFVDVKINDLSIIKNPTNLKLVKPEEGYAHIYFYRPYVYTGSALACKVEHNGDRFINIKTNSYFILKVKAGTSHYFNWNNSRIDTIDIEAEDGKEYFIRGSFGASFEQLNPISTVSNGMNIFLDNPKTARYVILTMKKESERY
jgi:hypothetical protein